VSRRSSRNVTRIVFLFFMLAALACTFELPFARRPHSPEPQSILGPTSPASLTIILQRLDVIFLGPDGHKLIGSGCPGSDGIGAIVDYHLAVSGVDTDRRVERVLVAGDNGTLTWEWPCSGSWGLLARESSPGEWDVFIAPSYDADVYTVVFFYDDATMAMGMVNLSPH
jgi:hypothetical protein